MFERPGMRWDEMRWFGNGCGCGYLDIRILELGFDNMLCAFPFFFFVLVAEM